MAKLTDKELEALGLENAVLGEPLAVPSISDAAAHGAAAVRHRDFEEVIASGQYSHMASSQGFEFESHTDQPTVWRIFPPEGGAEVRASGEPDAVKSDGDGEVIYVDFTRSGTVAVAGRRQSGSGFALRLGDNEPDIRPFFSAPDWLEVSLNSDLRESLAELDDPWLKGLLEDKLSFDTPWQHFLAIGTFVRLRRHEPGSAVEMVSRLLEGDEPDELRRERRWVSELDEEALRYLSHMALTAAESVTDGLDEFISEWREGRAPLARELADILHLRDDLASAVLLLDEVQRADGVRAALQPVDSRGEEIVDELSEDYNLQEDPRLQRAVMSDPHGWWTRLSAPVE